MTGSCLGDVAAALVDGELDDAGRERAHRHLAHCGSCRAEVDGQRRLKARLSGADEPELPVAFADRLLRLAAAGDEPALHVGSEARPPSRPPAAPGPSRAVAATRPAGSVRPSPPRPSPARSSPARSSPARPGRVLRRRATTGTAFALLGVAAALALGAPPPRSTTTPVDPTTDAFVTEFVSTTSDGPPSGVQPQPAVRTAGLTTFVPLTRAALLGAGGARTTR